MEVVRIEPRGCELLRDFTCGRASNGVTELVREQVRGRASSMLVFSVPSVSMLAVMDGAHVVGVAAWRPHEDGGVYLHFIGLSRDYRGARLGGVLLAATLAAIREDWGGWPSVRAWISPSNKTASELAREHGFVRGGQSPAGEAGWRLPAGRRCEVCGTSLAGRRRDARSCSARCRRERRRVWALLEL
jgi:ribosomal protein S18 acetylase RimI-like enzyme